MTQSSRVTGLLLAGPCHTRPSDWTELPSHPETSSYAQDVRPSPGLAAGMLAGQSLAFQLTYSLLKWTFLNPALDFNKLILLPNLSTNRMIENSKHMPATNSLLAM